MNRLTNDQADKLESTLVGRGYRENLLKRCPTMAEEAIELTDALGFPITEHNIRGAWGHIKRTRKRNSGGFSRWPRRITKKELNAGMGVRVVGTPIELTDALGTPIKFANPATLFDIESTKAPQTKVYAIVSAGYILRHTVWNKRVDAERAALKMHKAYLAQPLLTAGDYQNAVAEGPSPVVELELK